MSVAWVGAGIGAIGMYSSHKAQKDQARIQADAIAAGGAIDQAARNKAISQVLEIFGPSLVNFNESMQGSIDLMEQGRISTGDLLTQSAQNVSQITQQGGQNALNAMLGLPSPETVSTAQQPQKQTPSTAADNTFDRPDQQPSQPDLRSTQQIQTMSRPSGPKMNVQPDGSVRPGANQMVAPQQQAGIGPSFNVQPDGTVRPGVQQGIQQQAISPQSTEDAMPYTTNPKHVIDPDIPGYGINYGDHSMGPAVPEDVNQANMLNNAINSATPLEGELVPRDYNFNQQGIVMPQDTGAGLIGAVDAVQQGADLGRFDLAQGSRGALESLNTQTGIARDDIGQGRDFALNRIQEGISAARAGVSSGVGSINRGTAKGVSAINQGVDRATGYLNPYMAAGEEALNPYLALSGVRGQEAFDAARMNDPAYNLALQESERALGRNAAVTGGVGSGNTKGRFQLNAQQQAAADIDRQLGRFRSITDAGQQAAGTAGGFATQGGIASGDLHSRGGIAAGGLQARGGEFEASQLNRMGDVGIQSSQQLSQLAQQLGMSEAQVLQQLGGNLANIDVSTGNTIGGMRESAGINAANIIQNTSNQQAGIDAGLAQQLAGLDQNTLNNIVNSMQSGAGTNLSSQQQLATLLANMGIGAGTSGQQTAINLGQANASGVTNPIGNAINTGIGLYASGAFNQNSANPYQPASGGSQSDYTGNDYSNWVAQQT